MARAWLGFLSLLCVSVLLVSCAQTPSYNRADYQRIAANSNNPQVQRLARTMPKYEKLAQQSWPPIYIDTPALRPGQSNPSVPQIRQRLAALGDLYYSSDAPTNTYYDPALVRAVKHFQWRHGLKQDGVIAENTLAELNVTPQQRLNALYVSMQRWAELPSTPEDEYIQVNIPSYNLAVVENNQTVLDMNVVVGKPSWPTPTLHSKVVSVVLNPSWNVPSRITEKEIVHEMVKNPNYLAENNIKVYQSWKKGSPEVDPQTINWAEYAGDKKLPYRLSQSPGDDNALGKIKFLFPNSHDVYLHDTQAKQLFDLPERSFSHGCIRLQKPMELFGYILQKNPKLDVDDAITQLQTTNTKHLSLSKQIPIYITYITAQVDNYGNVKFYRDIYANAPAAQTNSFNEDT